jgi:hypothetical protein
MTPAQATGIDLVRGLATGNDHGLALHADGRDNTGSAHRSGSEQPTALVRTGSRMMAYVGTKQGASCQAPPQTWDGEEGGSEWTPNALIP